MRRTTKREPSALVLELAVMDAEQPQAVGPSALAEFEIVGVIDGAGKIRVFVIDAHGRTCTSVDLRPAEFRPRLSHRPSSSGRMPWVISGRCGTASPRWPEGMRRQHAAARRAVDEAQLDQEGLDDLLDRVARFRQRGGDGVDADRPAAEIDGDAGEIAMVERIEAAAVDLEIAQRPVGDALSMTFAPADGGEIAHPAQQPAGDARRAARAARDLARPLLRHGDLQHPRAAPDDVEQFVLRIEIEPHRNAEAIAQRRVVRSPVRVVAPMSVNFARSMRTERAAGPSPMMRSSWKSSIAG